MERNPWECPRCRIINAAWKDTCDCSSKDSDKNLLKKELQDYGLDDYKKLYDYFSCKLMDLENDEWYTYEQAADKLNSTPEAIRQKVIRTKVKKKYDSFGRALIRLPSYILTLRQAAKLAGTSKSTILRAIQRSALPAEMDSNRRWRIKKEDLLKAYPQW